MEERKVLLHQLPSWRVVTFIGRERIKDAETIRHTYVLIFSWGSNGSGGIASPFVIKPVQRPRPNKRIWWSKKLSSTVFVESTNLSRQLHGIIMQWFFFFPLFLVIKGIKYLSFAFGSLLKHRSQTVTSRLIRLAVQFHVPCYDLSLLLIGSVQLQQANRIWMYWIKVLFSLGALDVDINVIICNVCTQMLNIDPIHVRAVFITYQQTLIGYARIPYKASLPLLLWITWGKLQLALSANVMGCV